ncbi:hypothetical protein PCK1_000669, partial [Pneumocystis canis]
MTQIKDPRRENLIKDFIPIKIDEERNYTNVIVSILSFLSMIFKNKWFAWASLFSTVSGFLDEKTFSMTQGNFINLIISLLGLFTIYAPV